MKIETNAKDLLEGLSVVSSIVNPKIGELVKREILIVAKGDAITLWTFNDSTILCGELSGTVIEEGEICVEVFYLISLIGKFSQSVSISTQDGKVAIFKCGKSQYKTTIFPIQEFQSYISMPLIKGESVKTDLEPLKNAIACIYSSSAKEDPDLSGAYVYHDGKNDFIACSNTEVGACVKKPNLVGFPEGVIPRFLIDFIMKLKDIRVLELKSNQEGYFHGKAGKYTFTYRAPQFKYPWASIYEIIQNANLYDLSFKFNNHDMLDALSRISVITDDTTHAVKITIDRNTMEITVEGPSHEGKEIVDLQEGLNNPFSIIMDSAYLINILRDLAGTVTWSFIDSDAPQFVDDGFVHKFFMGLSE